MVNSLQCAAKMTKPAHLPQLSAPQLLSQVTLTTLPFGRLLEDIFPPPVSFYSIMPCRLKALSTNQKDGTAASAFFWSPFSFWMWLLLFIWRTCRAVPLGMWKSSVAKLRSGWFVPCLWSEPLIDVIGSTGWFVPCLWSAVLSCWLC